MKCTCPEHSPFKWMNRTTPSIFANDPSFMAKGSSGMSTAQIMSEVVKNKRKKDSSHGTIKSMVKDREEAMIKAKRFHVYSKAGTK